MTPSVALELIYRGHLVRSLRLAPLGAGAVAVVVFLAARRTGHPDVTTNLRLLGLVLALGSGFVLDDAAASTLQASPYGLARRVWLRIGCAVAVIAPLWAVLLARLLPSAPTTGRLTLGFGLTVELAAALAFVWAVAAWARRRGIDDPGVITAPALLALLFLAVALQRAPMLVGPGPQWTAAHLRWAVVLAGAAALLGAATRDPAARRVGSGHQNETFEPEG